jgi:hypothetical protein
MAARRERVVAALLDRHGRTYAAEAGIRLRDAPAPLFQLLCLSLLLSARIRRRRRRRGQGGGPGGRPLSAPGR